MALANRTLFTGDNLYVLRGMNSESVDLFYLDPPFNSNATYSAPIGSEAAGAAFKDSWALDDVDVEWHGQIADEHPGAYRVIDAAGTAHSKGMQAYLIMMGIRLIEMRRILKPTGSIYLHCDPTASHYLKALMDCIFGQHQFRNEITWKRTARKYKGSQHAPKRFLTNGDTILFYADKRAQFNADAVVAPYTAENLKAFKLRDHRGSYYLDTAHNRASAASRPNLCYEYEGYWPPHESGWKTGLERMKELDAAGDIVRETGRLMRKVRPRAGIYRASIWDDIDAPDKPERTGYPTQKPVALLERIIQASSSEGDFVFDPFCGCATTLVAAEKLSRNWGGGPTCLIWPSSS